MFWIASGSKVNHVIGAVSLTATIGTTITLTGAHYIVFMKKEQVALLEQLMIKEILFLNLQILL
jgi:hypothetical protein